MYKPLVLEALEGKVNSNLLSYVRNFKENGLLPKNLSGYRYVDLGQSSTKTLFLFSPGETIFFFSYCFQDNEHSYEWNFFNQKEFEVLKEICSF